MAGILKIAKVGGSISDDDKDLAFSSAYNGMKNFLHNTKAAAGAQAHGAGYTPSFLNFIKDGSNYRISSILNAALTADYSNGTNLVFGNANNYYFIFVDKIE